MPDRLTPAVRTLDCVYLPVPALPFGFAVLDDSRNRQLAAEANPVVTFVFPSDHRWHLSRAGVKKRSPRGGIPRARIRYAGAIGAGTKWLSAVVSRDLVVFGQDVVDRLAQECAAGGR